MILPSLRFGLTPEQENEVLKLAVRQWSGAKRVREEYEADWRELGKYFCPHLVRIDDTGKTKRSKWSNIINNTCLTSVRTLQAGMQSGLTNPSKPWYRVGLEDFDLMEYQPVRDWLEILTKRSQNILRRSNFYSTTKSIYTVASSIGTAGQIMYDDYDDVVNFQSLMTGRYWIGVNHKKRVDRVFVLMPKTLHEIMQEFPINNIPNDITAAYNRGDVFEMRNVMMAIIPNPFVKWDRDGMMVVAANQKPWVSVYWIEGKESEVLKTGGFKRFPVQAPRWEVTDDEVYGIGCGIIALGDTKAIQLKEREKAKGLQKMVSPPQSVPSEMRNGQFPISGLPGGATYRPPNVPKDAIGSLYEVNLPLQYLWQDIQVDEDRVRQAFFADLFLMLANSDRKDMTATEIAERHEEKLQALGPVVDQLNTELLDSTIEGVVERILEHDLMPPPPEELRGKPLKIDYISMLAQAQAQVGLNGIERFMQFSGSLAEMFPEVKYKVDAMQAVDEYGTSLGIPSRIMLSDDVAMSKADEASQRVQQQQQMQMGVAAVDAAQKLSQTQVGDSTALNNIAGV